MPLLDHLKNTSATTTQKKRAQRMLEWLIASYPTSTTAALLRLFHHHVSSTGEAEEAITSSSSSSSGHIKFQRLAIATTIQNYVQTAITNFQQQHKLASKATSDNVNSKKIKTEDRIGKVVEVSSFSARKEEEEKEGEREREQVQSLSRRLRVILPFLPALLRCVIHDSAKKGTVRLPTRLTVTASDCFLCIVHGLALLTQHMQHAKMKRKLKVEMIGPSCDSQWTPISALWGSLDMLDDLCRELKAWYKEQRPLFTAGLDYFNAEITKLKDGRHIAMISSQEVEPLQAMLAWYCSFFAPCLMEFPQRTRSQLLLETHRLLSQLQDPAIVTKEEFDTPMAGLSLSGLCLLLGRLDKLTFRKVTIKLRAQIYGNVFKQLYAPDERIHTLAIQIVQKELKLSIDPRNVDLLVDPLLSLLDTNDSTSTAIIGFIAEFAACNPERMLDQVFKRLDSTNQDQRNFALKILAEIFKVNQKLAYTNEKLGHLLANQLLERLHDTELSLRVEAANLFAHLDAAFIIPPLCRLVYHRDAKVRSAADVAIVSLLENHKDICSAALVLLDCLRSFNDASAAIVVPQNPGDIGKTSIGSTQKQKTDFSERVFRLIPKWAAKLPPHVWPQLISMSVEKVFAAPEDTILVSFMRCIGPFMGPHLVSFLPLVIQKIRDRPELPTDLDNMAPEDRMLIWKEIMFERISPLLVLRVVPYHSFPPLASSTMEQRDDSEEEQVRQYIRNLTELLLNSMNDDFDKVSKLSAEVCSFFDPSYAIDAVLDRFASYHRFLQQLCNESNKTTFAEEEHTEAVKRTKIHLFYFVNALMLHGKVMESWASRLLPLVYKSFRCCTFLLMTTNSSVASELANLVLGCIDCLGVILRIGAEQPHKSSSSTSSSLKGTSLLEKTTRIQEIEKGKEKMTTKTKGNEEKPLMPTTEEELTNFSSLFPWLLSQLEAKKGDDGAIHPDVSQKLRVGIIQAFIFAIKSLPLAALISFARDLIHPILHLYFGPNSRSKQENVIIIASPSADIVDVATSTDVDTQMAYLQLLFTITFYLKGDVRPYSNDLLEAALHALIQNNKQDIRIGGLKLLGALIGTLEDVLLENRAVLPSLQQTLQHIVLHPPHQEEKETEQAGMNSEKKKSTKQLAEQLLVTVESTIAALAISQSSSSSF
ncbi:hypothetical protein QOT17_021590 [Balamuthia mandrillaris]